MMYNGGVEVHRFAMCREGKNAVLRALRYFFISTIQFWKGICAKDIDLIYVASTPPTQGALAAMVKKFKRVPFVYNLQDIFPDSLAGTGLARKGGLVWKIGRMVENFTYRNADKIIVISQDFKKNIMAKGVPEEKIVVIYNWVDQNAVVDIPRSENILFDRYGLDRSKFYVTYNGNIGLTQNMDMLLEVVKALEANEDIQFVLVGNGAYLEEVKRIIAERNVQNVTMLPFQPYEEISHVFSLGDVSLVISKPGVGANSVPSKTWSIMSASRPVLANFDENELKSIIEKNNCGIFTKAGDKVAFADAILKLYGDRELCKEMGRNGRKFVMENLTKEIGTQKYVDVIKSFEKK
jgi:glycosyltransferase involved in cell wall biosynthesis